MFVAFGRTDVFGVFGSGLVLVVLIIWQCLHERIEKYHFSHWFCSFT